jgi:cation diffusion facilitator CzcD-associated flavoprotein CzcO
VTVPEVHDVVVVGAGFSGIAASVTLSKLGIEHVLIDKGGDIGGTWRDNVYPGCRCDVPSHLYSLSFAPNPDWSHTYSYQADIRAYLHRVADDHGVVERTRLNTELLAARWSEATSTWLLSTSAGELEARRLILGNGPLAEPALPDLPGIESFAGALFHSARWDAEHDFTGERVGVVGTGASAIQLMPRIQRAAGSLTVFQRTAPWVLPHRNRRLSRLEWMVYRRVPAVQKLVRLGVFLTREAVAIPLLRNGRSVSILERAGRRQLAKQVPDRELRRRLTPDYRPGCKRLLFSNSWYPTLSADNVGVVTDKVTRVVPEGVVTADGVVHELDALVFGTGFHVTDNPMASRITGRQGLTLADRFDSGGVRAYKGTTVPGFPNLFLLAGPNTAIGHTSLILMIEAQLRYIAGCLRTLRRERITSIEVRDDAFQRWNAALDEKLAQTVWNSGGCQSWYLDGTGRNTTMWPYFTLRFIRRTRRFDPDAYTATREPEAAHPLDTLDQGNRPGQEQEARCPISPEPNAASRSSMPRSR